MNFSLFLARRFFRGSGGPRASKPAVVIATAGVAVGLAVMIVAVCMVKGFQREVERKLTGFASHIEVLDPGMFRSPEDYPVAVDPATVAAIRRLPGVRSVSRVSQKIGVLKTDDDFQGIVFKGIGADYDRSFLKSVMVEGRLRTDGNHIVLSRTVSRNLGLGVGDRVYAYFFSETIRMRRFTVAGIYETHLSQFDRQVAVAGIDAIGALNAWSGDECTACEIRLDDIGRLDEAAAAVNRIVRAAAAGGEEVPSVLTVRDDPRTGGTFAWLHLLDFNVWLILGLMLLVAGFTMASGLLILILERVRAIGLLSALGARRSTLRHAFLWLSAMIVARGLAIGLALGLGIVWLQQRFGLVRLDPEAYYVDSVPIEVNWLWIAALTAGTLVLTTAMLVVPSFFVSRIDAARAIRYE